MNGTKDAFGNIRKEMSYRHLMESCIDFEQEITMLQLKALEMGVQVDRTPKCHCEIAGEGVEHSFGCAKNTYRRKKLSEKRGKQNFLNLVRQCFSRDVITVERVRKFSKRARQYIVAYHALRLQSLSKLSKEEEEEWKALPVDLEAMKKKFKTHRCVCSSKG